MRPGFMARLRHSRAKALPSFKSGPQEPATTQNWDRNMELTKLSREKQAELRRLSADSERDPFDPELWSRMGLIYDEGGDTAGAKDCYERAIQLDPVDPLAHSILGGLLRRMARLDEAREALETSLSLQPRPSTYTLLGAVHEPLGDDDSAIQSYRSAIETDPAFEEAYFKLACLPRYETPVDAVKLLAKAIELDPEYGDAFSELGAICSKLGEMERAERMLRRAIDLGGNLLWSHLYLGNLLWCLKRPNEAALEFEIACQMDESSFSLSLLGKFHLANDRRQDAERCFKRALIVDPSDTVAMRGIKSLEEEG